MALITIFNGLLLGCCILLGLELVIFTHDLPGGGCHKAIWGRLIVASHAPHLGA